MMFCYYSADGADHNKTYLKENISKSIINNMQDVLEFADHDNKI